MNSETAKYDIPAHKSGDTWNGISGITIFRNGSALDLTGATAKMQLRYQIDSPSVMDFSTVDNTIMLVAPTSGILDIPPRIVSLPPANYKYELKITLSSGEIKTFLEGSWYIIGNITDI